jgi:hypothetical protein
MLASSLTRGRNAGRGCAVSEVDWAPGEPLSPAEDRLIEAAANGSALGYDDADPTVDVSGWGPERNIRAAVLRHLVTHDEWPIYDQSIWLVGMRITGQLNLLYATLLCRLDLDGCVLDAVEPVIASHATAPRLSLTRCRFAGLSANGLTVTSDLDLSGSTITGPVSLINARIGGTLGCRGTTLGGVDEDGDAFVGDGLHASGGAFLDLGFSAIGSVRLIRAEIGRALTLDGARVTGAAGRIALGAKGIKVGGDLFARGMVTDGSVVLTDAEIAGSLDCSGADLAGDDDGDALTADGLTVGGNMFLTEGFRARGAVQVTNATIHGQLAFRGASLGSGGLALRADAAAIGSDLLLDGGFAADGTVQLTGTTIGGALIVEDAELAGSPALTAQGAQVVHDFCWLPGRAVTGYVDLERMHVGCLVDDWLEPGGHWPPDGGLRLVGFVYGSFGGSRAVTVDQRIRWIRAQYAPGVSDVFVAEPYLRLASHYREAGQEAEARKVAIARQNDLRRYGNLNRGQRAVNQVLNRLVRHGYDLRRAAVWLAMLYVAVVLAFVAAQHHSGTLVATERTSPPLPGDAALHCRPAYPCFYPMTHALDLVVPILDVPQADAWRPERNTFYVGVTVAATVLGWAFSTLTVLGFTGIARKE